MRIKNLIGLISIVACLNIPVLAHSADPRLAYKPDWSVGMKWKVEVTRLSEAPSKPPEEIKNFKPHLYTVAYQLIIETTVTLNEEQCFRIRIDNVRLIDGDLVKERFPQNFDFWRIYVRNNDYTLKRVERLGVTSEKVKAYREFGDRPAEVGDGFVGTLPMDFPSFNPNPLNCEPERIKLKDGSMKIIGDIYQTSEEIEHTTNGKKRKALKIVLQDKSEKGEVRQQTTQIWTKGMPWWSEATYEHPGQQDCTARLISVNGSEVDKEGIRRCLEGPENYK